MVDGRLWKAAPWVLAALLSACIDPVATPNPETQPDREQTPVDPQDDNPNPIPVTRPELTPAASVQAPDLVLMSFNIRYANSGDGENIWANRKAQLYALVKAQNPDVAGMQEVLNSQLTDLKTNLPDYSALGVGRSDGRTSGEFSPILFRTARFRADTSGTFWFSDTPEVPGSTGWGNSITRICTWARLVDKITGRGFYFYNIHLDHESQPSREKSVLLLMDRIGKVKYPSEPVFVTGDYNVGESDPVIRFMKGKGNVQGKSNALPMLDSFRMVDSTSTAVATWHDWTGDTQGDKIDYVFVLPRIKTLAAAIIRSNQGGKYPSDHFPVTASVTVPDWASTSIRRP